MHQKNGSKPGGVSRRQFLQGAGGAAAGSMLVSLPEMARAQQEGAHGGPGGVAQCLQPALERLLAPHLEGAEHVEADRQDLDAQEREAIDL